MKSIKIRVPEGISITGDQFSEFPSSVLSFIFGISIDTTYREFFGFFSWVLILSIYLNSNFIFSLWPFYSFCYTSGSMATIKDIAKLAGVSQGTVSNVLNGKGIVSSKKILLVEEAARSLGYTINEKAKLLRKGSSKILALVLPNQDDQQYVDFQISFTAFAELHGFEVNLYYTNDNGDRERALIEQIKSSMSSGIGTFTALGKRAANVYQDRGFEAHQVLFVERKGGSNFIGFDYEKAAREIASRVNQEQLSFVTLVTEETALQDELFYKELSRCLDDRIQLRRVNTNTFTRKSKIFGVYEDNSNSLVLCTHLGLARQCRSIQHCFFPDSQSQILTIAPLSTLPEQDFQKYELNYRYLGRKAAEQLLHSLEGQGGTSTMLENAGFRAWSKSPVIIKGNPCSLRMLLLDTPPSFALQHLARLYRRTTGVSIQVDIASYEGINEVLVSESSASQYDILRIGADVLSWDAPNILKPLDEIDFDVESVFNGLVGGIERSFSHVLDKRYAIPISPSLQVLYYRKDLFSKTVLRRLYQEMYHESLEVPQTFAQYNRIASFFSKAKHSRSPVQYGSTLVLGKTPIIAGTEFMTRYFSYADSLFDQRLPNLLSPEAEQAILDILALRPCIDSSLKWWTDAAESFANGEAAMTILFSNFASEFFGKNSLVSDKVGYSMIPGGSPLLGGGSLGVCKYSKYPEEALRFIAWLTSEPVSSAVALLGGNPISADTLVNYEVIETYPWMEMLSTGFTQARGQRTPTHDNAPFNDHKFVNLLGRTVWSCWYDNVNPKQALQAAYTTYCNEQSLYIR